MCVYLSGDNGIIRETRNGNPADRTPLLARGGYDQRGEEGRGGCLGLSSVSFPLL